MGTQKNNSGYIAVWISIIFNTILFGIKYWAGVETESLAMITDAWHTLTDSLSSIVVILGIWFASKPPDKEHPFGHGRAESIAAIVVATLLGMVGFNFIVESVNSLYNPVPVQYSTFSIIIFSISILIKEFMAQVSFRTGKKINSDSLKADAWHHRSDAISTIIIVAGAIFGSSIAWLDGVMGLLVSLLILWATYEIFKSSLGTLIGEKPDEALLTEIKKIISETNPIIEDVHHFIIHTYGEHIVMSVDIRLPNTMSVYDAHNIASEVSSSLFKELRIHATVHIEPQKKQ